MYPDLAAIVTAAVMGMMFYFGPWADPPGMDELWWLLTTAAVILASWRWWGKPTSYLITRVSIIIAAKSDVLRLQPTPWFDTCRQPGGRPVSDGPTVARSGSSECVSERKRAMPDLAYGRVHAEPTRA